jgi:uncharacterized protein (DUF1800 family)
VAGLGALVAARVAGAPVGPLHPPATESPTPSASPTPPARTASSAASPSPLASPSSVANDDVKLQHLLRRAGFGASPSDLAIYRPLGLTGTVDRLLNFSAVDNRALDQRLAQLNLDLTKRPDLVRWWQLRMIYTARPLEEKMTLFWHGLLTSAFSKVPGTQAMLNQNQFFRANALGRFPDILKGISRDPAMMIWLDLQTNRKGHANENYARELMELFSLGIGHYTETDVRESARAFTGWSLHPVDRKLGSFQYWFNPRQHDDGTKTFLGHTGNFNGDDIIDIIVQQPASASYIVRRLFSFFVYPNPTDAVLQPFVDVYQKSGYSIGAVMRAMLTSSEFYSPAAYRALVKSPAEFVAGVVRTLGAETDGVGLPAAATAMGQMLFNPPNVAGWPGGPSWITSGTWLARLNFLNRVAAATETGPLAQLAGPKGGGFALGDLTAGAASADAVVDRLAALALDGQIGPAQRQVLVDYLTPPGSGSLAQAPSAWLDERRRGALYLTLALPEYHLA